MWQMESLDPATHAYSFWEGVPPSGKQAFGRLFAQSSTLKASLGPGPLLLCRLMPAQISTNDLTQVPPRCKLLQQVAHECNTPASRWLC